MIESRTDCETAHEFERRLESLVRWATDNGVAFDQAWTVRMRRASKHDVMVEFVYLDDRNAEWIDERNAEWVDDRNAE